ncbi:MAG: aspartate carbamoyltransferase catalytic subunit [Myxococcota bacterium]|nr:aspartate carbamoyltransferase catalytic subunit [Myxococcota bacterium]MDW8363505.1 aspartate carbamoyltransferase catalytic subunit [Myxococcales bacterium]
MNRARHFLAVASTSRARWLALLEQTRALARGEAHVPSLRGHNVVTLFLEPSTRTRASFELAARRLGADVVDLSPSSSSLVKGESLLDTARNLEAMGADAIVVRHRVSGTPTRLAPLLRASVVNAGDGTNEHPTQALLDCATILAHKERIEGLRIAIVGDVLHSRVARSDARAFAMLGAHVRLCGPPSLVPEALGALGAEVTHDLDCALEGADVVVALRLQHERQQSGLVTSLRDYRMGWGIDARRWRRTAPGAILMHPGPVHRGVEVDSDLADGPQSVILEQVRWGLFARMAVLADCLDGTPTEA